MNSWPRSTRVSQNARTAVKMRLRGCTPAYIAEWLDVSREAVYGYLRPAGSAYGWDHPMHGIWTLWPWGVARFGFTPEELAETGARYKGNDYWDSANVARPNRFWRTGIPQRRRNRRRY